MVKHIKLAIIIPAYNEEKTIASVLTCLPKKISGVKEIFSIVIDDGSIDETYNIANSISNFTARHIINLGLGSALETGFVIAKKTNADIFVTIDADGQHNPKYIGKLIRPIINGEAEVTIGTRKINKKSMPWYRKVGNGGMNLFTYLVFGKWCSDSQSGMRAFSKKALEKMTLYSSGYEISTEIIGEVKRNKLKMKEVAIPAQYSDYSLGKGQINLNFINIFIRILSIISRRKT